MSSKKNFKYIMGLKIVLIANLLLLSFFSFNLFKEYIKNKQLNNEIKQLEAKAVELEGKNLDILDMAKYLDTEEFLESEARLKLGLKKPNETSIVVNIPEKEIVDTEIQKEVSDNTSNPVKWFLYFFNK